jgi:hypothetical protein
MRRARFPAAIAMMLASLAILSGCADDANFAASDDWRTAVSQFEQSEMDATYRLVSAADSSSTTGGTLAISRSNGREEIELAITGSDSFELSLYRDGMEEVGCVEPPSGTATCRTRPVPAGGFLERNAFVPDGVSYASRPSNVEADACFEIAITISPPVPPWLECFDSDRRLVYVADFGARLIVGSIEFQARDLGLPMPSRDYLGTLDAMTLLPNK